MCPTCERDRLVHLDEATGSGVAVTIKEARSIGISDPDCRKKLAEARWVQYKHLSQDHIATPETERPCTNNYLRVFGIGPVDKTNMACWSSTPFAFVSIARYR